MAEKRINELGDNASPADTDYIATDAAADGESQKLALGDITTVPAVSAALATATSDAEATAAAALASHASDSTGIHGVADMGQLLDWDDVVDEDDMASNSSAKVPTQQSVKAYTDTKFTTLNDAAVEALITSPSDTQTALDGRYGSPTDDSLFFYGVGAYGTVGSPSLGRLGLRFPCGLLDASTTEQYNWTFDVPTYWNSFSVKLLWGNAGAGSGNVSFTINYSLRDPGESTALGDTVLYGPTAVTAGAQDVIVSTTLGTIDCSAKRFGHIRVGRNGTDGSDTLPNDVGILGLRLERLT